MSSPDMPSFDSLIADLQDKRSQVRVSAAAKLGSLRDPRAVEPLAALLRHMDKNTQIAAAQALGEINDPRAIDPLSKALEREHFETFDAIKAALTKLGAGEAANRVSFARAQAEASRENREGGRSLLLWGVGLLGIGLLCSFGSYGFASARASQQAAIEGFGSAQYFVFSGPILLGGILLTVGFFRSQGAVDIGKIVASIAVGFFAFFDLLGLVLTLVDSTTDIPPSIQVPIILGMFVVAIVLAIRLAVRAWRDIVIAAAAVLLFFCLLMPAFSS